MQHLPFCEEDLKEVTDRFQGTQGILSGGLSAQRGFCQVSNSTVVTARHVPAALSCSLRMPAAQRWAWLDKLAPAGLSPLSWGSCLGMGGAHCKETPGGVGMSVGRLVSHFHWASKLPRLAEAAGEVGPFPRAGGSLS